MWPIGEHHHLHQHRILAPGARQSGIYSNQHRLHARRQSRRPRYLPRPSSGAPMGALLAICAGKRAVQSRRPVVLEGSHRLCRQSCGMAQPRRWVHKLVSRLEPAFIRLFPYLRPTRPGFQAQGLRRYATKRDCYPYWHASHRHRNLNAPSHQHWFCSPACGHGPSACAPKSYCYHHTRCLRPQQQLRIYGI